MQQSFDDSMKSLTFLFPLENNIDKLLSHKSFAPFDEKICSFLDETSKRLMKDGEAKAFPDVVTFAFFCRKANLLSMKKNYEGRVFDRLGRGLAFHIAPSNVPINFAYSLVAGLLAGNRCVARASSKDFPQTRIVCRAFESVAKEAAFKDMERIFSVVMYGHDSEITQALSSIADVRVIWGGDNTIAEIRKAPLKPRAFDIAFADRYSLALFNPKYLLERTDDEMKKIAQDFYNDTYLYDQNACSSPRLIVWLGGNDSVQEAKDKFWKAVHDNIAPKYELAPILSVDKLTAQCKAAVELCGAKVEEASDCLITRVSLADLPKDIANYTCAGGFYLEYECDSLDPVKEIINQKFQTLSYLGMNPDDIRSFLIEQGVSGVDRIVPVGKTADFGLVWDGYDLIETMSRRLFAV